MTPTHQLRPANEPSRPGEVDQLNPLCKALAINRKSVELSSLISG